MLLPQGYALNGWIDRRLLAAIRCREVAKRSGGGILASLILGSGLAVFGASVEHGNWVEWVGTDPVVRPEERFAFTNETIIAFDRKWEGTVVERAAERLQSAVAISNELELPIVRIGEGGESLENHASVVLVGGSSLTRELSARLADAPADVNHAGAFRWDHRSVI